MIDAFHPIHPALDMTVTKAELIRTIVDTVGLTQRSLGAWSAQSIDLAEPFQDGRQRDRRRLGHH